MPCHCYKPVISHSTCQCHHDTGHLWGMRYWQATTTRTDTPKRPYTRVVESMACWDWKCNMQNFCKNSLQKDSFRQNAMDDDKEESSPAMSWQWGCEECVHTYMYKEEKWRHEITAQQYSWLYEPPYSYFGSVPAAEPPFWGELNQKSPTELVLHDNIRKLFQVLIPIFENCARSSCSYSESVPETSTNTTYVEQHTMYAFQDIEMIAIVALNILRRTNWWEVICFADIEYRYCQLANSRRNARWWRSLMRWFSVDRASYDEHRHCMWLYLSPLYLAEDVAFHARVPWKTTTAEFPKWKWSSLFKTLHWHFHALQEHPQQTLAQWVGQSETQPSLL